MIDQTPIQNLKSVSKLLHFQSFCSLQTFSSPIIGCTIFKNLDGILGFYSVVWMWQYGQFLQTTFYCSKKSQKWSEINNKFFMI